LLSIPPGRIGLTLQILDEGGAEILNVSSTSPLYEDVDVGDRIMTVDGEPINSDKTVSMLLTATDRYRQIEVKKYEIESLKEPMSKEPMLIQNELFESVKVGKESRHYEVAKDETERKRAAAPLAKQEKKNRERTEATKESIQQQLLINMQQQQRQAVMQRQKYYAHMQQQQKQVNLRHHLQHYYNRQLDTQEYPACNPPAVPNGGSYQTMYVPGHYVQVPTKKNSPGPVSEITGPYSTMTQKQPRKKQKLTNNDENPLEDDTPPAPDGLSPAGGQPPGVNPGRELAYKETLNQKHINTSTKSQAEFASLFAKQALGNPRLSKKLLLSMVLVRENTHSYPSSYPEYGTVLRDGFKWTDYPPLDIILRENMAEYYELSMSSKVSAEQREFNREMVAKIKFEALNYGWEFDEKVFNDESIRTSIRSFYTVSL